MEAELRSNLDILAATYGRLSELKPTAVAALAFKDKSFFWRLDRPDSAASFTVRKYDEALRWFSANWPAEAEWPEGISRPENSAEAEAA